MLRLFALTLVWTLPAHGHEFDELIVARHDWASQGLYEIHLQDTVAGRLIVCALYDAESKLLGSETAVTDNLATRVELPAEGEVASVRCVFNN